MRVNRTSSSSRRPAGTNSVGYTYAVKETRFGWVGAVGTERGVAWLMLPKSDRGSILEEIGRRFGPIAEDQPRYAGLFAELERYFAGERTEFDVPIDPKGTAFQRQVWDALRRIPYGETRTYADVAQDIGRPRAARAVGQAVGSNPLGIVVPCHRVVASNGLGGFGGGLDLKRRLLQLEGAVVKDV